MPQPTPDELRAQLGVLDDRQRKIVAGVIALLFRNPERARDREWITEQFTQVTLLAGEFENEPDSADDAIKQVQAYAQVHIHTLLNASYALFQQVATDLAPRAEAGFGFEDAMRIALGYFDAPQVES